MATQGSPLSIFQNVPRSGDRRRTVRHKVHSPAYASFDGIGGGMVLDLTEIADIGEAGLSLYTLEVLAPNRTVNLVLDLSETKTYINITGFAVWSDQSGRTGIRFSKMPDATRLQLQRWLFFNAMCAAAKAQAKKAEGTPEIQAPQLQALDPVSSSALATLLKPTLEAEPSLVVADAPTLNLIQQQVEELGSDTFAALHLVAQRAQAMTRASGTAIALSEGTEMVCRASSGYAPPIGARFQVGSGFSGECVRTARLQHCHDAETNPIVDRESCRQLGIRSMVAAPIISNGSVVGLMEVFSPNAHAFEETDAMALRRLCGIVARVYEKQTAKVQALAELATTPHSDQLTFAEPKARLDRKTALLVGTCVVLLLAVIAAFYWVSRGSRTAVEQPSAPAVTKAAEPPVTTLDALRKYADKGDPVAQFALGARYAQGDGVKQDYSEALGWFEEAAEQGHVVAQATLGAYYWAGRGIQQDLGKAYFWSVLARAGGDEASKYRVAALTSRMTRAQVAAAQQQANEWLREHQVSNRAAR